MAAQFVYEGFDFSTMSDEQMDTMLKGCRPNDPLALGDAPARKRHTLYNVCRRNKLGTQEKFDRYCDKLREKLVGDEVPDTYNYLAEPQHREKLESLLDKAGSKAVTENYSLEQSYLLVRILFRRIKEKFNSMPLDQFDAMIVPASKRAGKALPTTWSVAQPVPTLAPNGCSEFAARVIELITEEFGDNVTTIGRTSQVAVIKLKDARVEISLPNEYHTKQAASADAE